LHALSKILCAIKPACHVLYCLHAVVAQSDSDTEAEEIRS